MSLKEYKKHGYLIINQILTNDEVGLIRRDLDLEFDRNKKEVLFINEFKNEKLIKKLLNIYKNKILVSVKEELEEKSKTKITVLPNFLVQKNYHVDLRQFHGWHRDCGGELRYEYCNNILAKENYFFSKIGLYLQENTDYGGSIDIIKSSHKNFTKFKILFRKIKNLPLKIIMLIHKNFRKIYNFVPEKFFMFFLNAKRLYPDIGSAVIFDSRIVHRGSPISKKKLSEIKYKKGSYQAITPESVTKYSIYCHFGSADGMDSYLFDRSKRKGDFISMSNNEIKSWIEQIEFISKYDQGLANQINLIFNPIKIKYQKPAL